MQKQMVQCEDGRRRQARIHGVPKEEGGFRIWKAGVRLKGKHVPGEAWYSYQTKTWYFISDPEGKHSHLMDRIGDTLRDEKLRALRDQLKQLESRQNIEQKKIAEHRKALEEIENRLETIKQDIARTEKGMPLESGTSLQYSQGIRRY
jgi:beta-phosphoglucomutase-like phosphatase (HAD superfamily)